MVQTVTETTVTEIPYLTVKEAAAALGISEDGVRKLIRREKLRAIKRSERNTLIPRPAFNAYVRKLNGDAPQPLGMAVAEGALAERVAAFMLQAGKEPRQWLNDWLSAEPGQDDAESVDIAVSAVGLVAEQRTDALQEPMLAPVIATETAERA
jgi:excisionase family DNA binding protein